MKCPIRTPVKKVFTYVDAQDKNRYSIFDATGGCITDVVGEEQADYIVQAINSHEKLVEAMKNANVWLGGKMVEPTRPTIWLKKYTQRHNECVKIIEQALKEVEKPK